MKVYVHVGAQNEKGKEGWINYLIEPYPEAFLDIINKITKLKRRNTYPLLFGLSNKRAIQTLYTRDCTLGNSLKDRINLPVTGSVKIATLTWNDFVTLYNIDHVDECLIDTEGSEEDILESMTKVLPKRLFVAHDHSLQFKNIKNKEELQKQLKNKGYKIVNIDKEHIEAILQQTPIKRKLDENNE